VSEMPLNEQMALNIEKNRLDKKIKQMELAAEERLKEMGKDRKKLDALRERIKRRASDMEKSLFSK